MYILFPCVDFCSSNFNKGDLKRDQKEEGRSKATKIVLEGNLNSSFVFCFKEHLNLFQFFILNFEFFRTLPRKAIPQLFGVKLFCNLSMLF